MERVVESDRSEIRNNVASGFTGDAMDEIEYRIDRPDGTRVLRGKGFAEFGADGKPTRMVGTVQDITDQLELESEMRRLREAEVRQAQALQLNDTIVQGLAAAKAALDLGLHDKQAEYLEATLNRARKMVGELLGGTKEELQPGDFVRQTPAQVGDASDP
jgi:hypothetical protein